MSDQDTAPLVLKCRYRYGTGCTAEYGSQPGLRTHEMISAAHELHRIELRDCPQCGEKCGTEAERAVHLSKVHGVRARSPERQEADARQVKLLMDAGHGKPAVPPVPAAPVPSALPFRAPSEPAVPSLNGRTAIRPDLTAARDSLAAILGENERLRAENAVLKADAALLAQVRGILAG